MSNTLNNQLYLEFEALLTNMVKDESKASLAFVAIGAILQDLPNSDPDFKFTKNYRLRVFYQNGVRAGYVAYKEMDAEVVSKGYTLWMMQLFSKEVMNNYLLKWKINETEEVKELELYLS